MLSKPSEITSRVKQKQWSHCITPESSDPVSVELVTGRQFELSECLKVLQNPCKLGVTLDKGSRDPHLPHIQRRLP